ncbi:DUF4349 domain-containing protein [Streptomyces sp. NPDC047130]|uniref:DUF4349 domain-containing protein n=1 Tax=Streptomyces sp. NPDC047130 TaxID=3155261 RepID=UPI0033C7D830
MAHMAHTARSTLAAVLVAASLALAGCGADGGDLKSAAGSDAASQQEAAAPGAGGEAAKSQDGGARKGADAPALESTHIIRTARLSVRVEDVGDAVAEARGVAEALGGYVGKEESHSFDHDGMDETELVLRVPSEKYDEAMEDLKGTGDVYHQSAEAEDVTDEVVDVDSRVKSQRAGVQRLRELMDEAESLTDVVALESELSSREAELDSLLARQKSLRDRTSLATVTMTLTDDDYFEEGGREEPDPGVMDALAAGWKAFVSTLHWIVMAVGAALPFAVVLGAALWLWLRLRRRRTTPTAATPAATDTTGAATRADASPADDPTERPDRP